LRDWPFALRKAPGFRVFALLRNAVPGMTDVKLQNILAPIAASFRP
jgi:hypothetical protein